MNLAHYESTAPAIDRSDRQPCLKAGGHALPAPHQTPRLLLAPAPGRSAGHRGTTRWLGRPRCGLGFQTRGRRCCQRAGAASPGSVALPGRRLQGAHGGPHTTGSRSCRQRTRSARRSDPAQAPSHDRAGAVPRARPLGTNAPRHHATLPIGLPGLPSAIARGPYSTKTTLMG